MWREEHNARMVQKWDQAIFPHLSRSDGKGRLEVMVVHRWEAAVLITAVYWRAAQVADSRKWMPDAAWASFVQPTSIKHRLYAGSEEIFFQICMI